MTAAATPTAGMPEPGAREDDSRAEAAGGSKFDELDESVPLGGARQAREARLDRACKDLLVRQGGIDALFGFTPREFLRSVPGRETFAIAAKDLSFIVKRANERDLGALFGFPRRSLAQREHDNLVRLASFGLPVPRALAVTVRRSLGRAHSLLVMEEIEHAETLRERLSRASAGERERWNRALADLVIELHGRGWYHRDLYLQHVLLRGTELVLIDVARAQCNVFPRGSLHRWFVKDLAALLHSTPRAVGARERLRFVARYLDGREIDARDARRAFIADVVTKERRMTAHTPRAGEDRPWEDR